ncbi:MAG: porin [Sulfuritalea sp.]|nr:porin [Sulfuritalea sp.]
MTVSGLVRMSVEQYKLSNVTGRDSSTENRISDQSSMLVFKGREDLGGGMYAGFVFDNRWAPDMGSAQSAGGNSNINIGGTWGEVAMGRQDLHYGTAIESYKAYTLQNILGNGIFAQVVGNAIANTTRTPNVIMYNSPNMSGFTGRLALSSSFRGNEGSGVRLPGANDPGKGSATNVELKYANGPIIAGYSYWRATTEGGKGATPGTGDQRGDTLQFAWTFPMGLKIGIAANQSKLEMTGGEAKRTAWLLPISYEFGANQVAFTYAKANNASGSFCGGGCNDTGANAYTLAYGRSLSKRTNLGVAYTKLDNKANATYDLFGLGANGATSINTLGIGGVDAAQLSVNMNHAF